MRVEKIMAKATSVYHPRARGGAMSDALSEARRAMARLMRILIFRGAGLTLIAAALAMLAALVSYNSGDASLNNANGRPISNLLGPLGAVAADILLQYFGLAAVIFVAPLASWGARALRGKHLRYAMWRAVAWPLGMVMVAAGLGLFPAPASLPAGTGGLIGIAAARLSVHAAEIWHAPWVGVVLPLCLLLVGLPLSFLATGLKARPLARGLANLPAGMLWLGGMLKIPDFARRAVLHDEDEERHEP
jgi:S-DNA-T family DNA segregation ATPase FtsK/SpoIIIE